MPDDSITPSEQLRQIIRRSPLSINYMAKLAGICNDSLYRFVGGHGDLSMETIDKLSPILGLSVRNCGIDAELAKTSPKKGRPRRA